MSPTRCDPSRPRPIPDLCLYGATETRQHAVGRTVGGSAAQHRTQPSETRAWHGFPTRRLCDRERTGEQYLAILIGNVDSLNIGAAICDPVFDCFLFSPCFVVRVAWGHNEVR